MSAAGRFAPSPSSDLHVGNLRTALIAWLAARHEGARFALRIDDLDAGRSRREFEARQLADLAALGLDHDGAVPRQSERLDRYAAAFELLQGAGLAYPCFCTRAEIREASSAPHGGPTGIYPLTCRDLTEAQRAERMAAGRAPAWRLRSTLATEVVDDLVQGRAEVQAEDVVLRRADGEFGYQLAVVLDDADQGVGEVVRGADLLPSVATQRELQRGLGISAVRYAHVPLMLGPDGARLAKRHGAATLDDARRGACELELPGLAAGRPHSIAAVRGALAASVGLCPPGAAPELAELVAGFAYRLLPTGSTMMQGC